MHPQHPCFIFSEVTGKCRENIVRHLECVLRLPKSVNESMIIYAEGGTGGAVLRDFVVAS